MNKQDLAGIISKLYNISKAESTRAIDMVVKGMNEALENEGCSIIRIANFGSFHKRLIKHRIVKNPKTGNKVSVNSYHQINFRASKQFKIAANTALQTSPVKETEQVA